ncbi:MAG: hypothetical protein ABSF98_25070 [Bryobacteraceae bacterium]|jgi:hypothetical protein
MAERRDPKSVRDWILWAAFETDSLIAQYYRAFGEDLDSDMAAASYAFVEDGDLEKDEGSYYLRRLWRVLLRKYAFRDAWVLDKTLCPLENGLWRCWRRKDLLLWRLAMGLFAGHVILWSSSGLLAFLDLVQWRLHWVVAVGAFSLFVVFALAVVDVQHRVGRRGWPVIFGRAALIMGIGVFYATVFGIAIYVLASRLAQCYGPHLLKSLLVASMALVLGFVFHLFWQEGSLGDPL